MKKLPFEVVKSKQGTPMVRIKMEDSKYKFIRIEEVQAILIRKMKINAEKMIGKPIQSTVITVPAYFKED